MDWLAGRPGSDCAADPQGAETARPRKRAQKQKQGVFVLECTDEIKVLPLTRNRHNPKAITPDGYAARAAGFSIQVYRRTGWARSAQADSEPGIPAPSRVERRSRRVAEWIARDLPKPFTNTERKGGRGESPGTLRPNELGPRGLWFPTLSPERRRKDGARNIFWIGHTGWAGAWPTHGSLGTPIPDP